VRQWLTRTIYTVLVLEVAVVVWFAATHHAVDFDVYMWGGHAVTSDSSLYLTASQGHWFTYPPFAAVVFAAISLMPFTAAQVLWELASVTAFGVACYATLRLAGQRPSRTMVAGLTAAGLALEPVYHTLFNGQINLILLAFVLTDVWLAAQGRRGGILVGIAAAMKLTPAVFVLFFLLAGRVRTAVTAAVSFAACAGIGFLVAPGASRLYWTRFFYDTKRMDAPYVGNQSIYGASIRILDGASHVGAWYVLLPLATGVIGLATATVFARHDDWLTAAAVTGVTSLLISPVSWTHHWVWALPILVVLARGARRDQIAAGCGYALFVLAPVWWTPHSLTRPDYGFHWLLTLAANCYVAAGFVFLAYMGWRAYGMLSAGPDLDHYRGEDVSAEAEEWHLERGTYSKPSDKKAWSPGFE
jgi:Glycosyltransferase family 87